MAYIKSFPNQNYLIPPKITDLFSENHVCYLIEQICNDMDFSEFDTKYAGAGHPAYHPRINIKLLLIAHVDGIRSSRKIAKNAQENVVYIYLSEKVKPSFSTISDFRKDNKKLVKNVFRKVNKFALDNKLIDLSHLAVDGTTIKANVASEKIVELEKLKKIDEYIDKWIEEGIKIDEEEDKLYGDRSMHELPKELLDPKKRRPVIKKIVDEINDAMKNNDKEKVQQIKEHVQDMKQVLEKNKVKQLSFIDQDSRFMPNKKGRIELSYNAQLVVEKNGLIVSNDVVQDASDRRQLLPNIQRTEKDIGKLPKGAKVSADGIFLHGEDMQILDEQGFDIYIPTYGMEVKNKFSKINFKYDPENDVYICPENKILTKRGIYTHSQKQVPYIRYATSTKDCQACPHRQACCKRLKHKTISALPENKLLNEIKEKMQTDEGKEVYSLRKQTVERGFADVKHTRNFREFLLRGLEKVKIEFDLVCSASNLVRINNLLIKRRSSVAANC